ncbi:ribbon-helix-helix domain-containing protein [Priestia megaterium]|uniref:ribbon-helix-helix domain-containing protein n=1 Tax=Priestia megaterium TaxID=1404 RepID=UPI00159BED70|nr:ribbon-helix-helix domain-containing protein [Priestia megaterium]
MHEKQKNHAQFVRLPTDILKMIDKYKETKGISSRNEAILELIKKGLNKPD